LREVLRREEDRVLHILQDLILSKPFSVILFHLYSIIFKARVVSFGDDGFCCSKAKV